MALGHPYEPIWRKNHGFQHLNGSQQQTSCFRATNEKSWQICKTSQYFGQWM